jgi:hypothetical protein
MGDMADFALDAADRQLEHYHRYEDAPLHIQYDEGIIDEYGATIGNPSVTGSRKGAYVTGEHGEGSCPSCGGSTAKIMGKYGSFFSCNNYPQCNGSRSK